MVAPLAADMIFRRTRAGETTLRQRPAPARHKLRRMLKLTNGRRDVVQLLAEFGDVATGRAALDDLQRARLITTVEAQESADGGTESGPPSGAGNTAPHQAGESRRQFARIVTPMRGRFGPKLPRIGDSTVAGLEGELEFGADGTVRLASVRRPDGSLNGKLTPRAQGHDLKLSLSQWRPRPQAALAFDDLDVEGVMVDDTFHVSRFEGRIYDGLVKGDAQLSWRGSAELVTRFELRRLNARKLLANVKPALLAYGEVIRIPGVSGTEFRTGELKSAVCPSAALRGRRPADLPRGARGSGSPFPIEPPRSPAGPV